MFRKRQSFISANAKPIETVLTEEIQTEIGGSESVRIETKVIDATDIDSVCSLGDYREGSLKDMLDAGIPVDRVSTQILSTTRIDNVQEKITNAISKRIPKSVQSADSGNAAE